MPDTNFTSIYTRLNPQQKEAVDTIDGPVMVIAGPGTGKTQVLAARIANILIKTDTKPHNILALTFTDSAAKNMRERVVQMIGKTGYYVHITTFHSFCKEVIETHPEYFTLNRESQALTEIERFDMFEAIITTASLDVLKPINSPLFYLRDVIKAISDLKKEGVGPEQFVEIIEEERELWGDPEEKITKVERTRREKTVQKHIELLEIYTLYQTELLERKRYDFDDMIRLVMQAFQEHEQLLLEYQENLHYFLVDEYQDTNTGQNTVVDLLASYWGEQANIFVVGDPHQAIYRFQGASVENMLGFIQRYPVAKVVTLEVGYRSTQLIYNAAHHLIQQNTVSSQATITHELTKKVSQLLHSVNDAGNPIEYYAAPSDVAEVLSVTEQIEHLIQQGTQPEEIAVLYRNNADVTRIQELLSKKNIRYSIAGGINILDTPEIHQLIDVLTLIISLRAGDISESLFNVMLFEWMQLKRVAVLELARFAGKKRLLLNDVLEKGYEFYTTDCETCLLTEDEWETVLKRLDQLKTWGITEPTADLSQWFSSFIDESGYLDWLKQQPNSLELLLHVNAFFSELKAQQSLNPRLRLADFLHTLELMLEHGLSIPVDDFNVSEDAVTLSTAHSAKGKEWQHVFIINCVDGKWGNSQKKVLLPLPDGILKNTDLSKKEKNEDDRRLFYVAITRAKQGLHISYPKTVIENSQGREKLASMFLEEIKEFAVDISDERNSSISAATVEHLETMLKPKTLTVTDETERAFYLDLVKNFALSSTALNDYLRDPQEFVYKHLLRVPTARSAVQAYGTAMHRALEVLYRTWSTENTLPTLDTITTVFQESLRAEIFDPVEYERRLRIGTISLQTYYNELPSQRPTIIVLEKTFGRGLSKTYLDDIALTGRIDRIDQLDRDSRTAKVIDYKTGKTKTLGDIDATTVTAQKDFSEREKQLPPAIKGTFKRQLLFYKLLTALDLTFKYDVTEGEFDFIEPDKQSGKLIRRVVQLEDEDVEELKVLIREVMKEIRELKFLAAVN